MTTNVIDCLRARYLGTLTVCAECAPEPSDCGSCRSKSCEEQLAEARQARDELIRGAPVQEISEGDRRVRYYHSPASINKLCEHVAKLEMECGGAKTVTVSECTPCGGTGLRDAFERVRPPPITLNHKRWI